MSSRPKWFPRNAVVPTLSILSAAGSLGWAFLLKSRKQSIPELVEHAPVSASEEEWVAITHHGVRVPDDVLSAAASRGTSEGFEVIDLIPDDLPITRYMQTLTSIDARKIVDPLALERGANQALVMTARIAKQCEVDPATTYSEVEMSQITVNARAAATRLGRVTTPLVTAAGTAQRTGAEWSEVHGEAAPMLVWLQIAGIVSMLVGGMSAIVRRQISRALPLLAYCLSPVVVFGRKGMGASREMRFMVLLSRPVRTLQSLWNLLGKKWWDPHPSPLELERPFYERTLAEGTEQFFNPALDRCPWCDSESHIPFHRVCDLSFAKPGTFRLDRCESCGVVFQNPPLNDSGLNWYYRDFYEGIGRSRIELVFSKAGEMHRKRAESVRPMIDPKRWLDIGTGYGHFCRIAQEVFPDCTYMGADRGSTVREALRRGWIAEAFQQDIHEIADQVRQPFDVVSMFHCLEHAVAPKQFLRDAGALVAEGGVLLIEVPNPNSKWATVLGKWWVHWFQPQHQQLFPVEQLASELAQIGFEIEQIDVRGARQPADLFLAVTQLMTLVGPDPQLPWLPKPNAISYLRRGISLLILGPISIGAYALDVAFDKVLDAPEWSNAYRIIARKPLPAGQQRSPR